MRADSTALPFATRLNERHIATGSLLCVGLDPHPQDLPRDTADDALEFCRRIVAATRPYALAYKPNSAFFERLGAPGWRALETLIAEIEPEIPVILDAKRGDISSTARAYSEAAFEGLGASAVTLHPLLGRDSLEPFVADRTRGVFVLCRTSNPGAADLQEVEVTASGQPLFCRIAALARQWDEFGQIGLVVGATAPGALAAVRQVNPQAWILAPGVGAQGGDLEATLSAGRRSDGAGILISVSRAISRAADPAAAAKELVHQIASASPTTATTSTAKSRLAMELVDTGCVRFGEFTLKSGLSSPIYLDLRRLNGSPGLLARVADAYFHAIRAIQCDRIAALPYAGLPIGTALSLRSGIPLCFARKEPKAYGTGAIIEGPFEAGDTVLLVDDLATRGTSAIESLPKLRDADLVVKDLVVLVDRQSGATERLNSHGVRLHAIFTLTELLQLWRVGDRISDEQMAKVQAFIEATR